MVVVFSVKVVIVQVGTWVKAEICLAVLGLVLLALPATGFRARDISRHQLLWHGLFCCPTVTINDSIYS